MDVIEEFNSQEWEIANEKDVQALKGFAEFQLFRRKLSQAPGPQKSSGEYIYCVKDAETDIMSRVVLTGCKGTSDPLSGVANCCLKLDANKKNIIGIHLSAQYIVKKQAA